MLSSMLRMTSHSQAVQSMSKTVLHWGSPKYYENRDPGPHFPMKMGTRGPQFGGSPFSHDTGRGWEYSRYAVST